MTPSQPRPWRFKASRATSSICPTEHLTTRVTHRGTEQCPPTYQTGDGGARTRQDASVAEELRRYVVAFRSINTGVDKWTRYRVLTWKGEHKAIALAAMAHAGRFPRTGILDVEIELESDPARDDKGVVIIEDTDLVDRMEW